VNRLRFILIVSASQGTQMKYSFPQCEKDMESKQANLVRYVAF
jgi:hypothetical protein